VSPAPSFIANSSPGRLLRLLLGSVALEGVGIWLVMQGTGNIEHFAVGILCMLFFGMTTVAIFVRVMATGPEARVDADGIWLRRGIRTTIPWSAIRRLSVGEVKRQRFLCLDLVDPAMFPQGGVQGRLAGANRAMGFGDVAISMTGTDRSFDELMEAVRTFAPPSLQI
jgi:hypothetical protein